MSTIRKVHRFLNKIVLQILFVNKYKVIKHKLLWNTHIRNFFYNTDIKGKLIVNVVDLWKIVEYKCHRYMKFTYLKIVLYPMYE